MCDYVYRTIGTGAIRKVVGCPEVAVDVAGNGGWYCEKHLRGFTEALDGDYTNFSEVEHVTTEE